MGILCKLYYLEAVLYVLVLVAYTAVGQFSHKKPWPTYSLQNMPQTAFTCHDKILGGYYADPETQCQMFHVCVKVAGVGVQDFRFLCPNGTAFDQEAQICADWGDVDCEQSVLYYGSDNFDLYRIGSGFESKRAPLAEEEEATFHLQRAESADIRRSKETRVDQKFRPDSQTYTKKFESTSRNPFFEGNSEIKRKSYDQNNDFNRVTQRFEAPKKTTASYYTTPRGNDIQADSKQDSDDLFKGSHSSNFFSNRNGGREDDFYESRPATASTTTTTSKPYKQQSQFFNGNAPQNDFKEFNKIPEISTKRPHRSRRPTPPQNIATNPTVKANLPSTTFNTPLADIPKTTKKFNLQTSFNFANDQIYKSPSASVSSTATSTTQRISNTTPKYPFNDYQQNIQPTTYSPSGAFRFKPTTNKYDDINETALRGEKPGQNAFLNSEYENQELDIFSRVSNRKTSNAERNPQKQSAKNTTPANRNEFTDFAKNKTPSGFQAPSRGPQVQANTPQPSINSGINVQPLDPSKLNSELRGINQTQQSQRERTPNRFNARQQTEPLYYRSKSNETPAPFTSPQSQKLIDVSSKTAPQRDFNRIRSGAPASNSELQQPTETGFQRDINRSRWEQRNDYVTLQRDNNKLKTEQQTENVTLPQLNQQQFNSNGYNKEHRDSSKIRPQSRKATTKFESISTTNSYNASPSPTRSRGRINYKATTQQQSRSFDNINSVQSTTSGNKKFSTLVPKDQYYPTTFKPTTYKKAFDLKPTKYAEPKSRGTTYTALTKSSIPSTTSRISSSTPDENDGQYHPELYDVDYSWNNVSPSKKPVSQPTRPQTKQITNSPQGHLQSQQQSAFQKQTQHQPFNNFDQQQSQKQSPAIPTDLSDEEELFKTAHSLNLGAASLNKLRADTLKTVDKIPSNSSPNFSSDRSTFPPPTSTAPLAPTTTTTWRPVTNYIAPTTTTTYRPPPKKSAVSKRPAHADADTSYDYAYYDSLSETPQEYPEYDVISEFRKTKKH